MKVTPTLTKKINEFGSECIYSPKQLSFILGIPEKILRDLSEKAENHYHPYRANRGNKIRLISNPDKQLKSIQRAILDKLLVPVNLPEEIFGARKGRDTRQNAQKHTKHIAVVTIDIRDCFPSVSYKRIFQLCRERFGYGEKVSSILTNLTTFRGSLPQGGVTSSMLLNLLLIPLCNSLKNITLNEKNSLSFWIDEINISGDEVHLLCQPIVMALQKFGFRTRSKKVKVMFSGGRQEITSITVNNKISVIKTKYEQYLVDAQQELVPWATTEGRLVYVNHINPLQGKRIKKRLLKNQHLEN